MIVYQLYWVVLDIVVLVYILCQKENWKRLKKKRWKEKIEKEKMKRKDWKRKDEQKRWKKIEKKNFFAWRGEKTSHIYTCWLWSWWFVVEWVIPALHRCMGHTAWAPVGREGRSQAGPKGHRLEVGARRAPKLLVYIYIITRYTYLLDSLIAVIRSLCSLSNLN